MKIGFFGTENSFALEMLWRLQSEHSRDEFLEWQPGDQAPSKELEVMIVSAKVDSQMASAVTKEWTLKRRRSSGSG